ncbi:hypothetical protein THAOC_17111 [Thalassiosira oceanica]|uniref:Uncharacterized protein n=1 Tax=Thalassiosira oceanica TaxID=159749 RepID=K0SAK1_THAOC|nr:hypothetical protein THAOC_19864 [Thalassiosira oceanica]EJK62285.1 hypothetical protein THAOC_17111 [Thalassiosira oceanica]|mmetsp:Transcript_10151/g.23778  ORF Transcript_10151/g.23778 Transcript_10151/m.23778 type:complete len:120 (+) Transcript_10151:153-512(+)|eukprot:EJK59863.1 hypothetical protein THAOC_19864 [Thalassiosira oceanica]
MGRLIVAVSVSLALASTAEGFVWPHIESVELLDALPASPMSSTEDLVKLALAPLLLYAPYSVSTHIADNLSLRKSIASKHGKKSTRSADANSDFTHLFDDKENCYLGPGGECVDFDPLI